MDLAFFEQIFGPTWPAVWTLAKIVAIVVPLLACVAYLTLWERKVIGWMQVRRGPNRVTFFGVRWLGGLAKPRWTIMPSASPAAPWQTAQ